MKRTRHGIFPAVVMIVTIATTAAHASPPAATAHPNPPRPAAAGPDCRVRVGDVRLGLVRTQGRRGRWHRAASAGAVLSCGSVVREMSLQVTIWKTGLLYDHEQAQTVVHAAAGTGLADFGTQVGCKDQTASDFFAVAYAVVYFGRHRGAAWVKSPHTTASPCGT